MALKEHRADKAEALRELQLEEDRLERQVQTLSAQVLSEVCVCVCCFRGHHRLGFSRLNGP